MEFGPLDRKIAFLVNKFRMFYCQKNRDPYTKFTPGCVFI